MSRTVDLDSFKVKDELSPDIWQGMHLDPEVRQTLLDIAQEFVDFLEVDVPIVGVIFTGSLANFNWSTYSDVDLHVLLDFANISEDIDLVRNLMGAKKTIWNDQFEVTVKGYEVELYAQDVNEPHHSTDVYDVTRDYWAVRPNRTRPQIDLKAVQDKAETMMDMIDYAVDDPHCSDTCFDVAKQKIKRMRQSGLDTGGEFSVENLAFKALRRNGYIEKLYDTAHDKKEEELTLEGKNTKRLYQGTTALAYDENRVSWWTDTVEAAKWFATEVNGRVVAADIDLGNIARIGDLITAVDSLGLLLHDEEDDEEDDEEWDEEWDEDADSFEEDEEDWEDEPISSYDTDPVLTDDGMDEVFRHSNGKMNGMNFHDIVYVPAVRAALMKAGFDSVYVLDPLERYDIPAYIVWDPSRIKLVTNESNQALNSKLTVEAALGAKDMGSDFFVEKYSDKADAMMDMIDYALDDASCSDTCFDTAKQKIKRMRQSGLDTGGEFSVENLAFKALRRNGYIEKLYDAAHDKKEEDLTLESHALTEKKIAPMAKNKLVGILQDKVFKFFKTQITNAGQDYSDHDGDVEKYVYYNLIEPNPSVGSIAVKLNPQIMPLSYAPRNINLELLEALHELINSWMTSQLPRYGWFVLMGEKNTTVWVLDPNYTKRQSDPEELYHVTTAADMQKIIKRGIHPGAGGKEKGYHLTRQYPARIYLTTDYGVAQEIQENFQDALEVPHVILKIDVAQLRRGTKFFKDTEFGAHYYDDDGNAEHIELDDEDHATWEAVWTYSPIPAAAVRQHNAG